MKKAFTVFTLLTSCATAQMVEGNIINSVTSAGIPQAAVHLESASDSEDEPYDTVTDALGHFAFAQIKPGTYQFSWFSPSYIATEAPTFPQIHVTAGGDPLKLEGRMTGTAMLSISGRVVDGDGNGVVDALVGIAGPSVKVVATTDTSGKFEQRVPQPGAYSLSVLPPAGIKLPKPEPGNDQARVWTPVYYPGVTLWEAASKIVVHPGDQIAGIQLKLTPVPAHIVRGMVLHPDGTPAPDVTVALDIDEARLDDKPRRPAYEAATNSDGAFEFPLVADGDLRIAAELDRGGVKLRALQWIEMAGHNIENVNLHLSAPFSVQGRVVMEAQRDPTKEGALAPEPPRLIPRAGRVRRESGAASWMLQPETMARPQFRALLFDQDDAIAADANRDRNFAFKSIYPDNYRIAPLAAPAGYYLESVRVGDTDVAAAEVQLSPGTLPITVEYKTGGGIVRGAVEKCASGAVLLIPTDANMRWFGFLYTVRCDAKDRYEIGAVRPGEYYALAFGGHDSAPSLDAGILQQARRITVKATETLTAEFSAIPE
jgi:hypothetical protein